jgi:hypothetical protein
MSRNEFLWVEKYRPKTIDDCILPEQTKTTFKEFLDKGEIPNLLLCEQLKCDYIIINGSDEGRFLDTVRNTAKNFASTVSQRILHRPSHFLLMHSTKSSLLTKLTTRPTMYSSSYGQILRHFIVTADSYLPAISKTKSSNHSTLGVPSLISPSVESKSLQSQQSSSNDAAEFFKRLKTILDKEGVEADQKVLAELINKHFPDWRRVLNECQRYSVSGKIDSAILASFSDVSVNDLLKNLKEKNFPEVRRWVVDNLDNDPSVLLRRVYDALYSTVEGPSIAAAVLIIAKYQYQIAFVADQEINLLAALTEIMVECNFK